MLDITKDYSRQYLVRQTKGFVAEYRHALVMKRLRYDQLPSKLPGGQGFDSVHCLRDGTGKLVDLVIGESKYTSTGRAALSKNSKGVRQMSEEWVDGCIERMRKSKDLQVQATGRLLDENRHLIRLKVNVTNLEGVNSYTKIKAPQITSIYAP